MTNSNEGTSTSTRSAGGWYSVLSSVRTTTAGFIVLLRVRGTAGPAGHRTGDEVGGDPQGAGQQRVEALGGFQHREMAPALEDVDGSARDRRAHAGGEGAGDGRVELPVDDGDREDEFSEPVPGVEAERGPGLVPVSLKSPLAIISVTHALVPGSALAVNARAIRSSAISRRPWVSMNASCRSRSAVNSAEIPGNESTSTSRQTSPGWSRAYCRAMVRPMLIPAMAGRRNPR